MGEKEEYAELKIKEKIYKFPIKKASIGPSVIDIGKLYSETGFFAYDPSYMSTASCESFITYIDGQEGILRYRGYDVKDLAEKSDFLETCYLLLGGELPTKAEAENFVGKIKRHSMVNEQLRNLFPSFRRSAHPMAVGLAAVGSLSACYHDSLDIKNPGERYISAIRMIAKMPTIAAMVYKYSIGQPFVYPKNSLSFTENFLYMTFSTPCEEYIPDPLMAKALDKIFILHADHEQNASTSTVRSAGSSGADPFACISAGMASLWGPAHGGANEAVIDMLTEIETPERIPEFIKRAKDKNDPFRLMGFGHRVYKHYDPRAEVLKETCKEVLGKLGKLKDNPLLQIAVELEKIALSDEYFIERKLYPNVDFYSGIIYKAMGIPEHMFTLLFAVARTAGWMAQWKEMLEDENYKIARPRQLYSGHAKRDFPNVRG